MQNDSDNLTQLIPSQIERCKKSFGRSRGFAANSLTVPSVDQRKSAPCQNPSQPATIENIEIFPIFGRLAQLVERLPYKQDVAGSSPSLPISFCIFAD